MDYPTNITNAAHRAQYDDIYRAAVEQVVDTVRQAFPQVEIDVRAITNPLDAAQLWYVAITFTWRAGPWVAPRVTIYGHELLDGSAHSSNIVEYALAAIARRLPDRLPPQE
jgi:hypothetical protein